jgi:hypothetical protein
MRTALGRIFVALALQCILSAPALASGVADDQAIEREFSHSKEPTAAVLFVQSIGRNTGVQASLTLYGDGSALVGYRSGADAPESTRRLDLGATRLDSILGEIVGLGLADWDADRIASEMLRANDGGIFLVEDGAMFHVALSLKSYRRGDNVALNLTRNIRLASPRAHAEHFPQIPELRALALLSQLLTEKLDQAGIAR